MRELVVHGYKGFVGCLVWEGQGRRSPSQRVSCPTAQVDRTVWHQRASPHRSPCVCPRQHSSMYKSRAMDMAQSGMGTNPPKAPRCRRLRSPAGVSHGPVSLSVPTRALFPAGGHRQLSWPHQHQQTRWWSHPGAWDKNRKR